MCVRPCSGKQRLLLAVHLLLLLAAFHTAAETNETDSGSDALTTAPPTAPATTTEAPTATVTPVPSPASTLSGCQVCASSGDCSHAYLDGPGKFCGNWYDAWAQRQRCCCPFAAKCYVTNYACKCRESAASRIKNSETNGTHTSSSSTTTFLVVLSIIGTIGACFGCFKCMCGRQPRGYTQTPEVVYAPVPVASPVGMGYGSGPGFSNHYYNNSNNSGGGASSALLGGTAGFVGGMFIGHALADGGHSDGPSGGYDGGGGDDGGGDYGGDF